MPTNRKIPTDLPTTVFVRKDQLLLFSNFAIYVNLNDTASEQDPLSFPLELISGKKKYKTPEDINTFDLFFEDGPQWHEEEQLVVMSLYLPLVNVHFRSWW